MIDDDGNVLSTLDQDLRESLRGLAWQVLRWSVVAFGVAVGVAAVWTWARGGWTINAATGFLPPHRGYSAYVLTPVLFLTPWPEMWMAAGVVLLLGGARAAWVGVLAGWAWRQARGPHGAAKLFLILNLAFAGVLAGNLMKDRGTTGDSVRLKVWRAALHESRKHPWGLYPDGFVAGVDGRLAVKAHSDVLQLLVIYGWAAFALVLWAGISAFVCLPDSPAKAAVFALTVQSVVDNRLHHWACAIVYAAVWVLAATTRSAETSGRSSIGSVADLQAEPHQAQAEYY